ncbi:MAG: chemotaxis-specific protein-glutamate methyltransferase CheB [Bdellovibrionaceae bacterium]|nr:chemotaxis-specific protein-glutamate methyltransferase CheB [Pseudobdellovibrionaceae bacterium]
MRSAVKESPESIQKVIENVSAIVTELAGIQLGERQFSMVENRLKTRMLRLNIPTFEGYLEYLQDHQESESQALLSLLTTHHTYFFREFSHFEFLLNKGLPSLIERARERGDKKIRIWSAASSRGQEAFSLAMFFRFHLEAAAPDVDFEIWGTDVDPQSVAHAQNSVYRYEELKQVPAMYGRDSWVRGTGDVQEFAKMRKALVQKCRFQTVNLLSAGSFLNGKNFDVIFCRNVFIYFNPSQIKDCAQTFMKHLDPKGFLFLGVSETLNGLGLAIDSIGASVYALPRPASEKAPAARPAPPLIPERKTPFRVLCVDDSPVILSLLKRILTAESGFTVAATAANGKEAISLLQTQTFDAITLDMHMPELDGLGFLEQTKGRPRPPVIILSSVNRDDPALGQKALALGAYDYVEKPSLENLGQAGNEIRAKIKLAVQAPMAAPAANVSTPKAEAKPAAGGRKKVLIVDDSATIRQLLAKVIKQDPQLEVVAEAERPSQVEALIRQHKPDVITLDIHMPEMDGVTLLKKIFPIYKIPVVMISSIRREEGPQVLQALESGAVDYIQKPSLEDLRTLGPEICERIRTASEARVVVSSIARRKAASRGPHGTESIVLMGASTGGTEALRVVLESLPNQIPPTLIVQHIPPVFSAAFAARLNQLCPFEVREAQDGDVVKPNLVLIAPGGKQMALVSKDGKLVVKITDDAPVNRHKPSVDYLFKSAADLKLPNVVGVILTGMGGDGARMLKRLRDQGARTIGQDEQTSVVYGMPREAAKMGAVEFVKPLGEVAETILKLVSESSKKNKAA